MRPRELNEEFNHLKNLVWAAKQVSRKTNINIETLKRKQYNNYYEMFDFRAH